MTRILLTLAGIAAGVTLALFGLSAAVGAITSAPAVKVPAPALVAVKTTGLGSASTATAAAVAGTPASHAETKSAATKPGPEKPALKAAAKAGTKTAAGPTAKPVPKKAAPAVRKPKHVAALPDKLRTLGGARQVVVVTSSAKSDRDGTLDLYNLGTDGNWVRVMSAPTRMGRNAMVSGTARRQGSSMTPTGSWVMPTWGFGWASGPPKGSRLGWKQIKSNSYWSAEQGSRYNTWVSSSSDIPGERLKSAGASYEFAIDSGYNALPNTRVYGRGTAIFIHVMHPGYTAGCISLPRAKVIELLAKLYPARHPRCVVGTTDHGSSTSIWAY